MSLSGALTGWFLRFAQHHPFVAAVPLVLFGLWLAWFSMSLGAEYDGFIGQSPASAHVVSADDDPQRDPRYAAQVTWTTDCPPSASPAPAPRNQRGRKPPAVTDPCVVEHRALVRIPGRLLPSDKALDPENRLRPGSTLQIVVSKTDPETAISVASLSDVGVITVGGRNFDGKALVLGALIALVGVLILVYRKRLGDD